MFGDNFLYSLCLLPPDSSLLMICLKGMKNHTQFAFESLHLFLFFMAYLKKKKKTQPKFSVLAMAKLFKSNLLDLFLRTVISEASEITNPDRSFI